MNKQLMSLQQNNNSKKIKKSCGVENKINNFYYSFAFQVIKCGNVMFAFIRHNGVLQQHPIVVNNIC